MDAEVFAKFDELIALIESKLDHQNELYVQNKNNPSAQHSINKKINTLNAALNQAVVVRKFWGGGK